ncbi:DUF2493 domain-containing protein [Kineosporia rhizophila]|uniref:DUF2493 domain-containing protein n=1 Tax=Kineosporia rhizophila TaxID=84633 RepID=UPI001E4D073F|nr:DUF2493 domain-containing protein [Kineosporia rhizophila]MCE0536606.1 DUF2493 domain-containing protein [Kineosporia rhizophila]
MSRSQQGQRKAPAWTGEELIACMGGDLNGQWLTREDWDERRRAAQRMAERGQRPSAVEEYVPSGHAISHPQWPQAQGALWILKDADPYAQLFAAQVQEHIRHTEHQQLQDEFDTSTADEPTGQTSAERAEPTELDESTDADAPGQVDEPEPLAPLRVLVTGSRSWRDAEAIVAALTDVRARLAPGQDLVLVHGAAAGVDSIADAWAQGRRASGDAHVLSEAHPADWRAHGRSAGPRRNTAMVSAGADVCLSFNYNNSRGTEHCTDLAERAGIPTVRHVQADEAEPTGVPAVVAPEREPALTAPARAAATATATATATADDAVELDGGLW